MSEEEAFEYLEFNTLCAYVGQDQPIFVDDLLDFDLDTL